MLGYTTLRRYEEVVERAKTVCGNAGQPVSDHFAYVGEIVGLGLGSRGKWPTWSSPVILTARNIRPEALPADEDVRKVERQCKSDEKKLPRAGVAKGKRKPKA